MSPANAYSLINAALIHGSDIEGRLNSGNLFHIWGVTQANSFKHGLKDGVHNITFKKIDEKSKEESTVLAVTFFTNGLPIEADIQISSKISDLKDQAKLSSILDQIKEISKSISISLENKKFSCH